MQEIQVSPWPLGEDSFHGETNEVFQVREDEALRLQALRNMDLADDGRPSARQGTREIAALTTALGAYEAFGLLFVQDGGTITSYDPSSSWATSVVVSGLDGDARVHFHEFAGQLWWTNGITRGVISSAGVNSHWGMTVPPVPTLGTTTGDVPAGRYEVVCTVEDGNGAESGSPQAGVVTLGAAGGITVDLSATDSNATHVNVYMGPTDVPALHWAKRVEVGSLPVSLQTFATDVRVTEDPLLTQFLGPPVVGDGVFSYMGRLLTYAGAELSVGAGNWLHLQDPLLTTVFPSAILGAGGTEGGFWCVTAEGAWWITGEEPQDWLMLRKDDLEYAEGQLAIEGEQLPALGVQGLVVLFVSERGLMCGTREGQMLYVTEGRTPLDVTGKRASIVLLEDGEFRQIIFSLI